MEDNLNKNQIFDKAGRDQQQGNTQEDQRQQREKKQKEQQNSKENKNWDQVQRRQQAAPRSYNTNLDEENIENQNTLADKEQTNRPEGVEPKDQNKEKSKGDYLLGDKASERQQTRDDEDREPNSGASKSRRVD